MKKLVLMFCFGFLIFLGNLTFVFSEDNYKSEVLFSIPVTQVRCVDWGFDDADNLYIYNYNKENGNEVIFKYLINTTKIISFPVKDLWDEMGEESSKSGQYFETNYKLAVNDDGDFALYDTSGTPKYFIYSADGKLQKKGISKKQISIGVFENGTFFTNDDFSDGVLKNEYSKKGVRKNRELSFEVQTDSDKHKVWLKDKETNKLSEIPFVWQNAYHFGHWYVDNARNLYIAYYKYLYGSSEDWTLRYTKPESILMSVVKYDINLNECFSWKDLVVSYETKALVNNVDPSLFEGFKINRNNQTFYEKRVQKGQYIFTKWKKQN
jgi:hypothetical protein